MHMKTHTEEHSLTLVNELEKAEGLVLSHLYQEGQLLSVALRLTFSFNIQILGNESSITKFDAE